MPSRAGSRIPKYRRVGVGRLARDQIAFIRTYVTGVVQLKGFDPTEIDEHAELPPEVGSEKGTSYVLYLNQPTGRGRPIAWNLSAMTAAELEVLRDFFNLAFDLADPVTRERDKVAHEAFEQGDDSYARVYRGVPEFVKRQRPQRADSEGVHNGSEGAPQGT